MTPEQKAEQIASEYHFLENEPKTDEAMQARIIDGALQMYRWAQTAIDDLELENKRLNAKMNEMANEIMRNVSMQSMRNNNMQLLKTKSKKNMSERILDATEKLCIILLTVFLWFFVIGLIIAGFIILFNAI
jgi:hypothetical protein